jgi:PAS domain S-box-containing protein
MASTPRRRSGKEIVEELQRLQETSGEPRDRLSMLHEISVYQEELIVQNEALTHAQTALEETRDRFIELYDFAPNAYLTLDANGVVRQCNLTAAGLIGKSKQALEGMPFLGFVHPEDRNIYLHFLRRCRSTHDRGVETELTITSGNGPRCVQLFCRLRQGHDRSGEYFAALVDITERKQLEREREQIARERAALATRLISVQEEERQRIARNLHDDLGQQVTALRLKLETLASAIADTEHAMGVTQLQDMLQQLDRRLHFVASELRPSALDLGIVAALEQFVREWSATFGVPAVFHSAGIDPAELAPHVETHLYRVAQEALHNAAKYASATHVTVLLDRRGDGVVLVIEDDGRGFDFESARSRGHGLGLISMRERAQMIGGHLEVETRIGTGTSIFLHVPHIAGR